MLRVIRVFIGLFVACVAAACVLIAHVVDVASLASVPSGAVTGMLTTIAERIALLATLLALFVIPFGLIVAVVAEINRWRGVTIYLAIGLAIACAGFVLQLQSEGELRTVLNAFAGQVFALQGLVGGFAYWLVTGRYSGWRRGGGLYRAYPVKSTDAGQSIADATEPTRATEPMRKGTVPQPGLVKR